jgi:hypothetical protein
MTMGPDGYPVIVHNDCRVVDCQDASCSTNTEDHFVGDGYSSIVIGTDGYPVVSYISSGHVRLGYCQDAACNSSTEVTIDATDEFTYTSLTLGPDGLPMIAYGVAGRDRYKFAHCGDYDCTSIYTRILFDDSGSSGFSQEISLTIGDDGLPIMSFYHGDTGDLMFYRCGNLDCTSGSGLTLASSGDVGYYSSISVGIDGFPVVAYYDRTSTAENLRFVKCGSEDCSVKFTDLVLDDLPPGTNDVGQSPDMTMAPDGRPIITYYDATSSGIKAAKCGNAFCISNWTRR